MNEQSSPFLRGLEGRHTYSQACQDLFVLEMLKQKSNGFYCEIGASHPFESNNTFLLESEFMWNGVSFELDPEVSQVFNDSRLNPCICGDATTIIYEKVFDDLNFPKQIDYLSIDIEPAENTFKALKQLPWNDYRFSVITYEHDFYVSGPEFMILSREFLLSKGYQLVAENVISNNRDFEDWWVDSTTVEQDTCAPFRSVKKDFFEIFQSAKSK